MSNPAYPASLPVHPDSRRQPRDGREEDIAGDGAMRVRKLYADKFDFELHHPLLTTAEQATLAAFYATNSLAVAIDLVWPEDGVTYVVRFGKNALRSAYIKPLRRDFWVRLVGV